MRTLKVVVIALGVLIVAALVGVALKIADGAGRAAEVATGAVLERLGIFEGGVSPALSALLRPVIRNVAGREVGAIRPTAALND